MSVLFSAADGMQSPDLISCICVSRRTWESLPRCAAVQWQPRWLNIMPHRRLRRQCGCAPNQLQSCRTAVNSELPELRFGRNPLSVESHAKNTNEVLS